MTSKISSINLRRENIKHRIGMIIVTFFFFFMSMLAFLLEVQNACGERNSKFEVVMNKITALAQPEFGMGLLAMGAAVLLAISSFRYLHSKTEVDFYHSLPIRRRDTLFIIMTNDIVLFAVPLVIVSVFKCIITAAVGYFSREFFTYTFWSVVCSLAVFAVTYLTMALAMLMTGNTFIGILGFCVFAGYSPVMLRMLYPSLASAFFTTYCVNEQTPLFNYVSPVSLSSLLLRSGDMWKWREHILHFAAIGVWIVLLLVICYQLFERRASETAGKAMAFPVWNPVIRFLLVVPGAIYAGLCLYAVSFTSFQPWIIVGIVIGGFFFHGVIECIYRFDVRGLWSNKRQMLASIGISFLIVGFFWLDVGGYDSYYPKEDELSAILIDDPATSYNSFWGKERNGVTGDAMSGTLGLLDKIIQENDANTDISDEGSGNYSLYTFSYKLKNGKEEKRQYTLSPKLRDELMSEVFDTMEYKKDSYSLYTADWSLVTDVQVCYPTRTETLDMTKEQRSELFRIYLEEHAALNYKTAKTMLPFGGLAITHNFSDGSVLAEYTSDVDTYYLYPSFKKTIRYLQEELGVELKTSMKDIPINHLQVSRYSLDGDKTESFDIFDEEFINSVKDRFCYGDDMWIGGIDQAVDTSVDLSATVSTEDGDESIIVYTDHETMEKIKKQGTFE